MTVKPEFLDYEKMKKNSGKVETQIIFSMSTLRFYSLIVFCMGFLASYFIFK